MVNIRKNKELRENTSNGSMYTKHNLSLSSLRVSPSKKGETNIEAIPSLIPASTNRISNSSLSHKIQKDILQDERMQEPLVVAAHKKAQLHSNKKKTQ